MIVWRIAADTPTYQADDLSGAGAHATGGRWNSHGRAVVYAAESRALAALETVVHISTPALPLNRYLVEIDIPEAVWVARQVFAVEDLPVGWDAQPLSMTSVQIGDRWLIEKSTAILTVPSSIVPEERAVLINPGHPDFAHVRAKKVRKWIYDGRLGTVGASLSP